MRRGPFGFPTGRPMSASLYGFPLGEDADSIPRFPPIQTGLVGWYDFSDYSSLTMVSDLISQINDKSGSGNHASQSTAGNRPGWGASRTQKINDFIIGDFDGNDFLDTALAASDTTISIFAVCTLTTVASERTLVGTTASANKFLQTAATPQLYYYNGNFNTMTIPLFVAGQPCVAGATVNASGGTLFLDSYTGTFATAHSAPSGNYRLGAREIGQNWLGAMAEILLYDSELSLGDARDTMTYLRTKWAISR